MGKFWGYAKNSIFFGVRLMFSFFGGEGGGGQGKTVDTVGLSLSEARVKLDMMFMKPTLCLSNRVHKFQCPNLQRAIT